MNIKLLPCMIAIFSIVKCEIKNLESYEVSSQQMNGDLTKVNNS